MHDEPFRALRELDRVAGRMLSGSRVPLSAPMDVWREGRTYHVELDLPGVAAGDIDLQIDRNTLTVTAERRAEFDRETAEDTSGDREILVAERPHGSFRRQLVLGEGLDADGVQAQYVDGVLRLAIPLAQASRPRRIDVTAGAQGDATGSAGTTGDAGANSGGDAQEPGTEI